MKNDFYIYAASICILVVLGFYAYQFHDYVLSKDVDDWNQFGGYVGGVLGPTFSFLSFVMLIKSLNLQNESNASLREESRLNIKNEKLRSFETHFFNLLGAQRESFEYFKLTINGKIYSGVEAVRELESAIQDLRAINATDEDITNFIKNCDADEKLFNTQRTFFIVTKTINQKLSDENGFSAEERKAHLETMINFTEFSLLRVVLISMQFLSYRASKLLNENDEFISVLEELKLPINAY
ncbi:hypothetical protein DLH98_09235 [Vibrio parahaemolyticus]|uniref:Phage abortive infection protein n=1 Tax=Vibrio parahaemolyticus TaxID=670 RepID=A0AAW3IS56_VIBPH|nr:hypothetical protein [Vibrio parahaemolyticus]EGQ8925977.1 hypothetical protein [Vibrio parahaemolyticus]EGR2945541.1 hypothetical protein [Vibrio parahaemolyticus]EHZ2730258.1 hypothetical protein [Vibrio parahaemolyticus]EJB1772741.1 hypothetical protein [Vibrio parahaemolyticus]KOY19167.1 hypothetical protein ACX05_26160 [Vibrio parahaemolyticus]